MLVGDDESSGQWRDRRSKRDSEAIDLVYHTLAIIVLLEKPCRVRLCRLH